MAPYSLFAKRKHIFEKYETSKTQSFTLCEATRAHHTGEWTVPWTGTKVCRSRQHVMARTTSGCAIGLKIAQNEQCYG